jgi:hypothetical protein
MSPVQEYQFQAGKYLMKVDDKSSSVFVADGEVKTGKNIKSSKGTIANTIPKGTKIETTVIESSDTDNLVSSILAFDQKTNAVKFAVINGKVIGIKQ